VEAITNLNAAHTEDSKVGERKVITAL
jgi:hypothetical protein